MEPDNIYMVERVGVAFVAFLLCYRLLTKNQERSFQQSDLILKLVNETLADHTKLLGKMCEGLDIHIRQKDSLIDSFSDQMKECRYQRDQELKEIRDNQIQILARKGR